MSEEIKEQQIIEVCHHKWSSWFGCEVGLGKECKLCGESEVVKSPWFHKTEEDRIKWKAILDLC